MQVFGNMQNLTGYETVLTSSLERKSKELIALEIKIECLERQLEEQSKSSSIIIDFLAQVIHSRKANSIS